MGIVDGRATDGSHPDVAVVDLRADAASGMAAIERLRVGHASMAIFAVAVAAESDLILGAMRAGANEFFPWTPGGQTQASRSMEESFHGAVRKTAARREAAHAGTRQPCVSHVFLGAKGGAGTTTYNAAAVVPVTGGILEGVGEITLDTSAGTSATEEPTSTGTRARSPGLAASAMPAPSPLAARISTVPPAEAAT